MKGNQLKCSTFIKIFQITLVLFRENFNTYVRLATVFVFGIL